MTMAAQLRPVLPILIGASVMLSLAMGVRQSLGLFMTPLTREIAVTITDFTLAIAIQNLLWGIFQPITGALVVRVGFRPLMVGGAMLYVLGLVLLARATGFGGVMLGAGVCIGIALACTASALASSVASRAVPPAMRSTMLGIVSAAGSIGALISAPIGQGLSMWGDWRTGVIGFVVLAAFMVPAAWIAGRADKLPIPAAQQTASDKLSLAGILGLALRDPSFMVMTAAFFVCGLQLVFLTTHLPAYLALCGMDPMLSATALGVIGGFNVAGSLFFGWAGGRWNKQALLGGIYIARSLVLAAYFVLPPTTTSTIIFAAAMGFLWLGVAPLIAGAVIEMFGLKWQAMLQGVTFFSHQIGSFVGALGGGWLFDKLGNYDLAWRLGVAMGLAAGLMQLGFALFPPGRGRDRAVPVAT
jgi:predicted MFS family arabinose efflux permease